MALDQLPHEILALIIQRLGTWDLKALALTWNKAVTSACIPVLRRLSDQVYDEKHFRSLFPQEYCHDFIKIDMVHCQCRGCLGSIWRRWIESYDPLEREIDFPHLEEIDLGEATISPQYVASFRVYSSAPITRDRQQRLSEKAASLAVQIPPSFWKAMSDPVTVSRLSIPASSRYHVEVKDFVLVHTSITRPNLGFVLPFMHHDDLWSWCLYLESGERPRHCVIRLYNVLKTTEIDDMLMWEMLSNDLTDDDRQLAERYDVRHEMMSSDEMYLAGMSFQQWLMHNLFIGLRPYLRAVECAESFSDSQELSDGPTADVRAKNRRGLWRRLNQFLGSRLSR
jgi:hypothetical protein